MFTWFERSRMILICHFLSLYIFTHCCRKIERRAIRYLREYLLFQSTCIDRSVKKKRNVRENGNPILTNQFTRTIGWVLSYRSAWNSRKISNLVEMLFLQAIFEKRERESPSILHLRSFFLLSSSTIIESKK